MALYSICSCVKMYDRDKVLSNMHKIDIMDDKTTRLCDILENRIIIFLLQMLRAQKQV